MTIGLATPAIADDLQTNDKDTQLAQAAPASSQPSSSATTGPIQQTPPVGNGGAGGGISSYTIRPQPPLAQDPNALADSLKYRGWIVPLPSAAGTVDGGAFGLRQTLAEAGISYFGFSTTTYEDNVIRHGLPPGNAFGSHSRDEQVYAGQLPTYTSANTLFVMYDLARFGIPDGQITAAVSYLQTNWQPGDPNGINIGQLSYYQTLFNKKVEFKVGYLTDNLEFLGTQVGGNIGAGLFGVSAFLPFEEGQSLGSFPTPAVNVTVHLPANVYTKLGVSRATSPDGLQVERSQNRTGFRFTVPNSGVFVIDETGYRVPASLNQMSTWLRAAANYTSSRYVDLNTGQRHGDDYGLYALADRQLFKTNPNGGPRTQSQGLYAGLTAMYAPSGVNAFTEYFEARAYGFGLIPGRPFDLTSLVYNKSVFSSQVVNEVRRFGGLAHDNANTYTAAYNISVVPGVSLNLGVSYTDNPSPIAYNENTGSALNFLSNLFVWF